MLQVRAKSGVTGKVSAKLNGRRQHILQRLSWRGEAGLDRINLQPSYAIQVDDGGDPLLDSKGARNVG